MQGYGGSYASQFWCFFDNEGYIVAQELSGQTRRIGVSLQKFNQTEKIASDALAKAEGYLKTLEEHGLIQRELTADERLAVLSTQLDTLTKVVEQQAQMIGALTATKAQEKPKAVDPEIMPNETREGLNDKYVASGISSQALVSQ